MSDEKLSADELTALRAYCDGVRSLEGDDDADDLTLRLLAEHDALRAEDGRLERHLEQARAIMSSQEVEIATLGSMTALAVDRQRHAERERDDARAEVERLEGLLEDTQALVPRMLAERDAALAEVARRGCVISALKSAGAREAALVAALEGILVSVSPDDWAYDVAEQALAAHRKGVPGAKCGVCGGAWDGPPGKAYCASHHGLCGICSTPRATCRCLQEETMQAEPPAPSADGELRAKCERALKQGPCYAPREYMALVREMLARLDAPAGRDAAYVELTHRVRELKARIDTAVAITPGQISEALADLLAEHPEAGATKGGE